MITVGFMASVLMYVLLAVVLPPQPAPGGRELELPLAVLAIIALFSADFVARFLRRSADGRDAHAIRRAFVLSVLVGLAVREVAAILGFLLTRLTSEISWTLAFSALTVLAMYRAFPRDTDL